MPEPRMKPSEVRKSVLSQHREIEVALSHLRTCADRLLKGEVSSQSVKEAAHDLRSKLEVHMRYEERILVPEIEAADGFGPERARHMRDEHLEQQRAFDRIVAAIDRAASHDELAKELERFASELESDIAQEERDYLSPGLLKDSLVPTDSFGG